MEKITRSSLVRARSETGPYLIISVLALLELPGLALFIGVLSFQSAYRGSRLSFVRG